MENQVSRGVHKSRSSENFDENTHGGVLCSKDLGLPPVPLVKVNSTIHVSLGIFWDFRTPNLRKSLDIFFCRIYYV